MVARSLHQKVTLSVQEGTPVAEDQRRNRLLLAAVQLLSEQGIAGASARSVASLVGAAPSAISYNFGNMERLLSLAFEHGVTQTARWLDLRRRDIAALPRTPDGAAQALNHVLYEWTTGARALALLYQECLAAGAGTGVAATWTRVWRDFWLEVASTLELEALDGRLMHLFFESEALYHLSVWSPALERGVLVEMCDHFAATWLGAPPRIQRGATIQAEQAAGARAHGSLPDSALRIAEAAAEVVEQRGLNGLTHRAVAAHAKLTTGAVTHHFRSIEDLVAGAIRGQVQAMMQMSQPHGVVAPSDIHQVRTAEQLFETLKFLAIAEQPASPVVRRRRLFLAAVRRPGLAGAGAVIRFSQGGTVRDSLSRIFEFPRQDLVLQSSVLSRLMSSIWFACSADEAPEISRDVIATRTAQRFIESMAARAPV